MAEHKGPQRATLNRVAEDHGLLWGLTPWEWSLQARGTCGNAAEREAAEQGENSQRRK